ncbi:MAG: hypothetical protein ABJE47_06165 [bacterium]
MTALTPEQRRTALCQTLLIYQDAKFAVRPLSGACERHIPMVRRAIAAAYRSLGLTPVSELVFQERLQAIAARLDTARMEALAMIMDVSATIQLDQMAMAAALKNDAVLPVALKMSPEQVEGPLAAVLEALQDGLAELSAVGNVPQRTIEQHRELVPIMRGAGGRLLQHVSTAAWAARACKVLTPYSGVPRIKFLTPMQSTPAVPSTPVAAESPDVAANAPKDHRLPEGLAPAPASEREAAVKLQGQVDVEAYFERKRRRAAGEQVPG